MSGPAAPIRTLNDVPAAAINKLASRQIFDLLTKTDRTSLPPAHKAALQTALNERPALKEAYGDFLKQGAGQARARALQQTGQTLRYAEGALIAQHSGSSGEGMSFGDSGIQPK